MIQRDGHCESLWQSNINPYQPVNSIGSNTHFDAIIIGGGITGITTALLLQEAGKKCLVLEAHTVCFGTTGGTTAHINTLLDTTYDDIQKNFGKDAALQVCKAAKQALHLVKNNIDKYNIDCGFTKAAAYLFSQNEQQTKMLEDIQTAATEVGLNANYVSEIPVPRSFEKAIRVEDQAKFNPVKYVFALAEEFEKAGGIIAEHCRVKGVNEKDSTEVETEKGLFTAGHVIYATHIPPGVNLLHLRCSPYRSYAMAVKLNAEPVKDLSYDLYDPYHYYRTQHEDGVDYLIAGGYDHKTGHEANTEKCFKELEAHIRSHFDVKEIAWKWSSQFFESADGLPYIGRLPGHEENILVATGFGGNGMTYSHVSAIILKHIVLGLQDEKIQLFSPRRVKPVAGFKNFISHNADVVAQMVSGLFSYEKIEQLAELAPGEAKLVKYEKEKIALYKDEQGKLHAINPACTHMKCMVEWNGAERSWDCPCHGARYAADGTVLTGPASVDLKPIQLPNKIP